MCCVYYACAQALPADIKYPIFISRRFYTVYETSEILRRWDWGFMMLNHHITSMYWCHFCKRQKKNAYMFMWNPEINDRNHVWSLFNVIHWLRDPQSNPEFTGMVCLTSPFALGIPCLYSGTHIKGPLSIYMSFWGFELWSLCLPTST